MNDDKTSKKDEPENSNGSHATSRATKSTGKSTRDSKRGSPQDPGKRNPKTRATSRISFFISGFMMLAIVIAFAGLIMLWQQQQRQQNEDKKYQQQIQDQSRLIFDLESKISNITGSQDQLRSEIDGNIAAEINNIERSIADIKESGSKNYRDWVLSESEYLLQIANHRLQLEADINTAIKALRIADSKITGLKDPSLLPVRKQLADEISALESTQLPDIRGMVLTLDSLQAMSPKIDLKISIRPPVIQKETQENKDEKISLKNWEQLLDRIWNELKTLVVIKKHDQSLAPVLTMEQQQTIRHILQLKIQGIRTALLNKQPELFMDSIKDSLAWLQENFDGGDSNVALLESRLEEFQAVQLNVKLPDIGGSLRSLRSIQKHIKNDTKPLQKPVDTSYISIEMGSQVRI